MFGNFKLTVKTIIIDTGLREHAKLKSKEVWNVETENIKIKLGTIVTVTDET